MQNIKLKTKSYSTKIRENITMNNVESLLEKMVELKGSDLFLTAGAPATVKINGELIALNDIPLNSYKVHEMVFSLMSEYQRSEFTKTKEYNFAIQLESLGRFRVSAFQQRSNTGAVLRRIETQIPTLEALNLPKALEEFSMITRGLIIVVGATGAGKSSTLAAMIGHRNINSKGHIVSLEDPIEYIHEHKGCIITQREIGIDTDSYDIALKNTLRQAPNVIVIGEIRSSETMNYAITFAETGHLCVATLHANNANQALERIAHFMPIDSQRHLWMDLSLNLKAIVAQQLVPKVDGNGRVAAVEILVNTPVIADHIRKGEIDVLKELMAKSGESNMQTFDQALFALYNEKKISYESALKYADSVNELRLMIKLNAGNPLSTNGETLSIRKD